MTWNIPLYNCDLFVPINQTTGWLAMGGVFCLRKGRETMKRFFIAVLVMAAVVLLADGGFAQGGSRGTSKIALGGKAISVEYGRPALKGRTVTELLDQLKPGDFWRLGADKSTTFSSAADLQFGDAAVPAGQYSLWVEREANNSWKLVFNKQHGQWGTQHDASQDLASAPLKETKAPNSEEMVTITLSKRGPGGAIVIQWGDMKLNADFKLK